MNDFQTEHYMASTFKLEIISPHGIVYTGDAHHVRAPGVEGSFGVLPGHTPFLSPLQIGVIEAEFEGKKLFFATSGGLAEVHGDKVVILAETAEARDRIDISRAEAAAERARKRLAEKTPEIDVERAHLALVRALNRLRIAGV
jgi:F-type H+-transporting ATPase subunit epsilon